MRMQQSWPLDSTVFYPTGVLERYEVPQVIDSALTEEFLLIWMRIRVCFAFALPSMLTVLAILWQRWSFAIAAMQIMNFRMRFYNSGRILLYMTAPGIWLLDLCWAVIVSGDARLIACGSRSYISHPLARYLIHNTFTYHYGC